MEIPAPEQERILTALGFAVTADGDRFKVSPPTWRPDVQGEADLVEEVARVASLTKLQGRPLARAPGVARPILTPTQRRERAVRRRIASAGYDECVTYSFIDAEAAALFGGGGEATRLENPISSEMSHMRPALLPGLLRAAARNQARGFNDLALFEVGQAFHGGEPEEQALMISGIRTGHAGPRDPHGARRPVDVFDVKADVEAALEAASAPARVSVGRDGPGWWHPGRHGVVRLGPKTVLAEFGEIHPRALAALDVKGPAVGFTVHLEAVPFPRSRSTTRPALAATDLQHVERDFAFVVESRVEAEALVRGARAAKSPLIADVAVFDVFSGPKAEAQMGEGRKSIAISVRLEPRDATLTEAEIEDVSAKIVAGVASATGGVLRT